MMYNHELTLISYKTDYDDIGNPVKTPIRTTVLCKVASIGSTEYYNAQVINLKPEIKFIIHAFEYGGEREVEFQGTKYQVIRTFQGDTADRIDNALKGEELELICERVLGHG